jgi:hypothetical protein
MFGLSYHFAYVLIFLTELIQETRLRWEGRITDLELVAIGWEGFRWTRRCGFLTTAWSVGTLVPELRENLGLMLDALELTPVGGSEREEKGRV